MRSDSSTAAGTSDGSSSTSAAARGPPSARASRCSRSPWCCRCRPPSAGRSPSRSRAPRAARRRSRRARARSSGRRSGSRGVRRSASPQRSKTSGTSRSITVSAPSGVTSGSPAPRIVFISVAQTSSSSGGRPMKLPITRETTGWATSSTRSQVSRPSSWSSTSRAIARISSSCSAIRFGVKPRWKSALMRSCLGGSIPMNIACCSSSGRIAFFERRDAAELRGVGLPVAADLVHVVGGRHRPEAVLVRELGDAVESSGPGTRRAAA